MPASKNVQVLQGQDGAAETSPRAASSPAPKPAADDVSGHYQSTRVMECWSCHGLSYIDYDTDAYHLYSCCHCGAVNRF